MKNHVSLKPLSTELKRSLVFIVFVVLGKEARAPCEY